MCVNAKVNLGGDGVNAHVVSRAEKAGTYRIQATILNNRVGVFTLTGQEQVNPPKRKSK